MRAPILFRPLYCRGPLLSLPNRHQGFRYRKYATYHDTESSVLSQSLDTKQRALPQGSSVGPFRLGLAQSSLRRDENVPKWSELNIGGKGTWINLCVLLQPHDIGFSSHADNRTDDEPHCNSTWSRIFRTSHILTRDGVILEKLADRSIWGRLRTYKGISEGMSLWTPLRHIS